MLKESILPALEDPSTATDPRTWHVAGLIGYKINEEYFKQMALGKDVDIVKKGEAVDGVLSLFFKGL